MMAHTINSNFFSEFKFQFSSSSSCERIPIPYKKYQSLLISKSFKCAWNCPPLLFPKVSTSNRKLRVNGLEGSSLNTVMTMDTISSETNSNQTETASAFTSLKSLSNVGSFFSKSHFNFSNLILKDFVNLVKVVNSWEPHIRILSDEQLREKTNEFKNRLKNGETLEDIQAEAFAVVREASRRVLGLRHFDVQIIGGAVLHSGAIAEMKTGEGKTLVSTLPAYLNALTGKGVHVVTVNDYLAKRDAEWMGKIHRFLGLTVGLIQMEQTLEEKQKAYSCDITYANNSEIAFDYLRDNLQNLKKYLAMPLYKQFNFAILDEVDSVLVDEGANPLIINSNSEKNALRCSVAARVANLLKPDLHYSADFKTKSVELTDSGIARSMLVTASSDLWGENWAGFINSALVAKEFKLKDRDYIVLDDKILIVDEFTGRVISNRRWGGGIHQAVEAKEGVPISPVTITTATVTYQAFFRLYSKCSGMTGTAKTEEKEFLRIFNMPVIVIPTNLPNIRIDNPVSMYRDMQAKWNAVVHRIQQMHYEGRPVLVGTTSVEESEIIQNWLLHYGLQHRVLNARPENVAREAEIIAQAGRFGAITIATNMAGRGTDIILGGNPQMLAKDILVWYLQKYLGIKNASVEAGPHMKDGLWPIILNSDTQSAICRAQLTWKIAVEWSDEKFNSVFSEAELLNQQQSTSDLEDILGEYQRGAELAELVPAVALAHAYLLRDCTAHCEEEGMEVKGLGGLHVIGTSMHESRRVDNQLRGRAGRQGDPGSTEYIISFQDRILVEVDESLGNIVSNFLKSVDFDDGLSSEALDSVLSRFQSLLELENFAQRKSMLDYEDFVEAQRKHIYNLRKNILVESFFSRHERMQHYIQDIVDDIILPSCNPQKAPWIDDAWQIDKILNQIRQLQDDSIAQINNLVLLDGLTSEKVKRVLRNFHNVRKRQKSNNGKVGDMSLQMMEIEEEERERIEDLLPPLAVKGISSSVLSAKRWKRILCEQSDVQGSYVLELNWLRKYLGDYVIYFYEKKFEYLNYDDISFFESTFALKSLDQLWAEHLQNMSRLRSTVGIMGYGRKNPIEEFKIESTKFFILMLSRIRQDTIFSLLNEPIYDKLL